jgi:AAA domain-containing protein
MVDDKELNRLLGIDDEPDNVVPLRERRRAFQEWTYEEIAAAPPTSYLIGSDDAPILLEKSLWQTLGLLKSAKTFYCLELAFCVAFGLTFEGHPVKEGNVAYVIAEGGIKRNFERVRALFAKYDEPLRTKFDLAPDADLVAELMRLRKFNLITDPIDLASLEPKKGAGPEVFLNELKQENYVLVVLDTWARMLWASGGHDSDQNVVGPAIAGCERIRRALDCTVIMVAHVGVARDAQKRAKGLSDPAGAIDGATLCTKTGKPGEEVYTFEAIYQRFAQDGFEMAATLQRCGPNVVLRYGETVSVSNSGQLPKSLRLALGVLERLIEAEGEGVSVAEWSNALLADGLIKPGSRATVRSAFKRIKDKLLATDSLTVTGDMVTLTYKTSADIAEEFGEEED